MLWKQNLYNSHRAALRDYRNFIGFITSLQFFGYPYHYYCKISVGNIECVRESTKRVYLNILAVLPKPNDIENHMQGTVKNSSK